MARGLVLPHVQLSRDYLTVIVAVFGTTISPYLFFWQAAEEVEEEKQNPASKPLLRAPQQAERELTRIHLDTFIGMAFSNLIALFIVLTAATTLHAHGIVNIETSSQAAEALRPIAGEFAFVVFALGVIGTGMLAVPVLAGSAAYAIGEALKWKVGLTQKPHRAPAFYITIAVATAIGAAMNFMRLDPIRALFWSAVINGVVAVPLMTMIILMASQRKVMGKYAIPFWQKAFGWLATAAMACAAVGMVAV